ncbi:hypothetical protein CK203_059345 [Vitis vinifera]|uniref:Ubiquitin-like protease family profile domain-containing protein n=1 Tax=Vitis vinifera TaxID=29760 RepID=A0A438GBL3_VITVI|nr:hypothetical protein CK203_059345 [Vitis vinifera]
MGCSRGSVECGYYVMRYMRDIIADQGCLTSKFHGKKSYSKDELNEVRSEWVMLVTQLILLLFEGFEDTFCMEIDHTFAQSNYHFC